MIVDLHTHTTCSDGRTPPRELIRLARQTGVDVIAVTDHDSVEALPECIDEGRQQGAFFGRWPRRERRQPESFAHRDE